MKLENHEELYTQLVGYNNYNNIYGTITFISIDSTSWSIHYKSYEELNIYKYVYKLIKTC